MSNKELALNLLNSFDESQLFNIVAMLKIAESIADEATEKTIKEYDLAHKYFRNGENKDA